MFRKRPLNQAGTVEATTAEGMSKAFRIWVAGSLLHNKFLLPCTLYIQASKSKSILTSLARTRRMLFPETTIPSEMLSVTDFLSEPFPGDTRLFSCPQRQIFCLFVLCLWPLGTACFYDFITAGRDDDLSEAQRAWFLHQWPFQATGMEN